MSSTYPAGARAPQLMIERARVAREAGLDALTMGADHVAPGITYLQGASMLGRLLAEWDPVRSAGCLFLVPMWHPVILAEQIATLAAQLDAPFIIQTGLGRGEEMFAAMGKRLDDRAERFERGLDVIQRLLAGETVGSEHHGIHGAAIAPIPSHRPEVWVGAIASAAIERAGRLGDAWYAGPNLDPARVGEQLDRYRESALGGGRAILRKDVIILREADRARRLGDDLLAAGYRGMGAGAVAYGGVHDVADALAAERDRGWDDVIIRCMTIEQGDALETIELAGVVREQLRHG